ncbi:recombinase family protein [Azospirillum sp. sgz302134]
MRVSKADGSQVFDLQRDALLVAGVDPQCLYEDLGSGRRDDRPGLRACLKALRGGDTLAEFERELIAERTRAGLAAARARGRTGGRKFKMTAAKLRLAMAAMGKPETKVNELCRELGITRQTLYRHVLRLAMAAMGKPETKVNELCRELGITRQTLYRHVGPDGSLREDGRKLLDRRHG